MNEPIYIIDGYGLIYSAYYAFFKNPLRNPAGKNTSAVYGFLLALNKLIRIKKPRYLCVAMDSITPTFRHQEYPEYKANRDKTPDDLHPQIPRIEAILEARGIPCFRINGFEADDIIAAIARKCREENRGCFILSKDKDLMQLVDDTTKILYPEKGLEEISEWGRDEVFERKGIYPEQVIDYLSLTGDDSDNIPGVLGIGEKTALKLLAQFETLDNIYAGIDSISSKSQKQKLLDGKADAYLSKKLIILKDDIPVPTAESFTLKPLDRGKLISLYKAEGFQSFLKDLDADISAAMEMKSTAAGTYKTVTTLGELDEWISKIKKAKVFAFDTETDNINSMYAKPIGFSLAVSKNEACYVPIRAQDSTVIAEAEIRKRLQILLEDTSLKLVGQNIKYDYKVMKRWGIEMRNIYFDTMVAAWVLDATAGRYNMDRLAEKHLDFKTIHYSDLIPKSEQKTLLDIEIQKVTDYSSEDADITYQLYKVFAEKLETEPKLKELFHAVEMPLVKVLSEMEMAGICLDAGVLSGYGKQVDAEIEKIEKKIFKDCGHEFNIRSTKELQNVLFNELDLKPSRKIKTGFSTDSQVLEDLAQESVVAGKVLEHRTLSKLKSTYIDALPLQINTETKRLHTEYLQTGTATGRLSSIEPNLQNIPVRDEEGRLIRTAFTADKGHILLSADYSQIELVILAHISGDERLVKAFNAGKDIHTHTSSLIFGKKETEITTAERRIGKTINFGVIYGMSAFRLARDFKISRSDAEMFINAYFKEYAGVDQFKKDTITQAKAAGYVETMMGRRRLVPNINNDNMTIRSAEERIAVNTPIQGTAADIVKTAMIRIREEIIRRSLKTRLLLQVHDELIFEVPLPEVDEAGKIVKNTLENIVKLKVPLLVTLKKGNCWGEMK